MVNSSTRIIPSPNIWHWPDVYEVENAAQDVDGAVFDALREAADWTGKDVADVGCGSGFHLPLFAVDARSVVGVEPHAPLVDTAIRRMQRSDNVSVRQGAAERLPLPDASVDIVHARTAYFFDERCTPGIAEAMRVLRPGGNLIVVDLDATAHPYGAWMRADLPHYDPLAVESFFRAAGFGIRRVDTRWVFPNRAALQAVLGIEFSAKTAAQAFVQTAGLALDVRYRIHLLAKPSGFVL